MKTKTKWLIWLRFASLFLSLFSEVNAGRSCRGLLKNVRLPTHTNIAAKQRKANHVTLMCDNGYQFSRGKSTRDLPCAILRRSSGRIRIPRCKDYSDFSLISQIVRACGTKLDKTHTFNPKKTKDMPFKNSGLYLRYKKGLDLIFVLDTSSTVTRRQLNMAKKFMKMIVLIFGVDERANGDGTHIACVNYGTRTRVEFKLNEDAVDSKEKTLKKIEQIDYIGGVTETKLALVAVRNLILPSSRRLESKKALFLLTDGGGSNGATKQIADCLKNEEDVEIYVIGIGRKIRDLSLRSLASKYQNVFAIKGYNDLIRAVKIIVEMSFRGKKELHRKISQQ